MKNNTPRSRSILNAIATLESSTGRNPTRHEVMGEVMRTSPGKISTPDSNRCYFRPATKWNVEKLSAKHHNEAQYSLIVHGLVKVAGTNGRKLTYTLTHAGRKLVG